MPADVAGEARSDTTGVEIVCEQCLGGAFSLCSGNADSCRVGVFGKPDRRGRGQDRAFLDRLSNGSAVRTESGAFDDDVKVAQAIERDFAELKLDWRSEHGIDDHFLVSLR